MMPLEENQGECGLRGKIPKRPWLILKRCHSASIGNLPTHTASGDSAIVIWGCVGKIPDDIVSRSLRASVVRTEDYVPGGQLMARRLGR